MEDMMNKSAYTALLTPVKNQEVDQEAFEKVIERQISAGIDGIVICGTTGEGSLFSKKEQFEIIKLAADITNKRLPIIAGASAIQTEEVIELAQQAEKAGADIIMTIVPYYIKPSQEAIYYHFRMLHDVTRLPIIIYNNPNRCGVEASAETIIRLGELERIIGLKDCSKDFSRIQKLRSNLGKDFKLLSGDDISSFEYMSQGGDGVVSVASNILVKNYVELIHAFNQNDILRKQQLHQNILPFIDLLTRKENPVFIKHVASRLGLCSTEVRFPLQPFNVEESNEINNLLAQMDVYNFLLDRYSDKPEERKLQQVS